MSADDWHVYPTGDMIQHAVDGGDCICDPTIEPVPREDGSIGWLVKHHSLDGREFTEHDYTGPAMPREQ